MFAQIVGSTQTPCSKKEKLFVFEQLHRRIAIH